MNSRHAKRLVKAKSQEILDGPARSINFDRPNNPQHSNSNGIVSKMKKVLGSYTSSPMEKRRARSFETLNLEPTFGVPIQHLLQKTPKSRKMSLQHPPTNTESTLMTIPHIVTRIIEHVEGNGLRQEGIYRVNGNARIMENLKISFNRIGDADLMNKDIFSVGGVLKLFLRELPVSLIPEQEIDKIVELQEATKGMNCLLELRDITKTLPLPHYDLLKFLCRHLLNVSKFSDENKMTPVSLSIVFGPSVFKCGGGLDGLKKQGHANAAFSKMIQNYQTIFEDDSLLLDKLSEQSSDGSFGSRFKKIRKKPKKPEPYHKHKEQRLQQNNEPDPISSEGVHLVTHHKRMDEDDMDKAIDQAFEAVIREDIEAGASKKQRKSEGWLATQIAISKPKGLFQSNDITARVSSPYSWKSSNSTGTSPTSSPVVSPRSSEVFTTLIGDVIQDHLFETQTMTTSFSQVSSKKPDTNNTLSSFQQASNQTYSSSPESSNEDMKQRINSHCETDVHGITASSILRRNLNKGSKNRRSAVYSETTSEESQKNMKKFTSVDDLQVQLLTVNDDGGKEWKKTQTVNSFSSVTRRLDTKQLNEDEIINDKDNCPNDECVAKQTAQNIHIVTQQQNDYSEKIHKETPPDEFDSITRTTTILYHPTLQRVRVPLKRAKPSRRSVILRKGLETKSETLEQFKTDSLLRDSKIASELMSTQGENIPVSSYGTVSSSCISKSALPSSLPEDSSLTDQPKTRLMQMERMADNEDNIENNDKTSDQTDTQSSVDVHIAPTDYMPVVFKGWSKSNISNPLIQYKVNNDDNHDINIVTDVNIITLSYEDLLRLAQKLRSIIREFESDFFKTYGRKPSMVEQTKVKQQIDLLNDIKKRLKESSDIRTNDYKINGYFPKLEDRKQKSCNDLLSHSVTKLDQASPSVKKRAKLARHQSLGVHHNQTTNESDTNSSLTGISRKMLLMLAEKREKAKRPEALTIMTYEQLVDEKQAVQKMLLNFEKKFRRPQTREEKESMRPIYDRYRDIKKQLTDDGSRAKKSSNIDTEEMTLESVSILQASLTSTTTTTTSVSKPVNSQINMASVFPDGPSSFVLPLSPAKHTTFRKHSSLSPTNEIVSLLPSSSKENPVDFKDKFIGSLTSIDLNTATILELHLQLTLALAKKKELRTELREFEHEFEKRRERPLTKNDRKQKLQQYTDYKSIKSTITEINDLLAVRAPLLNTT